MTEMELSDAVCKCGRPVRAEGQGYCRECHAAYMRLHRVRHVDLTPEQRLRANARSYANVYQRNGKLIPQPCEVCGSTEQIEKHHDDHAKPLEVRWLCRPHHVQLTEAEFYNPDSPEWIDV